MSEEPHYVRRHNRWVPGQEPMTRRDRWEAAHPIFRWSVLIGIILVATAMIVYMSIAAGDAAADGYGPLMPVAPSPTPYPNGWTP